MPAVPMPPPSPAIIARFAAVAVGAPAPAAPAPPSEALLARTLAEAERLALLAPEKELARANSLVAAADAYVAAGRLADARRLYRAAVASARRGGGGYVGTVLRYAARGQVAARDDAQAANTAKIAALGGDTDLARKVAFLVARRDAPAGSPLRTQREDEAFQAWSVQFMGEYWEAQRKQARPLLVAALDDTNADVVRRLSALAQLLTLEPGNRSVTAARYLPAISEGIHKLSDPAQRAQALAMLAQTRHEAGDAAAAQSDLAGAVEAAAVIPDAADRLRVACSLLSTGAPSPRALAVVGQTTAPPLELPAPLRERVTAFALSALESLARAKPGEAPADAVQRLIGAADYGQDVTGPLYTPERVLGLMKRAVAEAKKLPQDRRQVSLRLIAMVQARAADPDAVLTSLRLSPDRAWRVRTLLELAWDAGAPGNRTPAEQAAQRDRLADAALVEARAFPPGPARYHALAAVLRAHLTTLKGTGNGARNRALFREMAALAPEGNRPFPAGWVGGGDAPAGFLVHLAHFGQRVGDHAAARALLARAAAMTIKSPTDASPGADFLFSSIARAQAFSGDFAGAKATLRAASAYRSRVRYLDEQTGEDDPGSMRAGSNASHAVEQAAVRDFSGALHTVTTAIPARFVAARSGALSGIAREMAAARNGKPIQPYPDYVW